EYKGADTTNPLDVKAAAQGNSASESSGAATTTSANDLIVGANMTTVGLTTGPGASFTSRVITSPDSDILEDRIAGAAGSYAADAPLSASGPWIMQMVAFRPAGSSSSGDTQAPTAPSSVAATAASSNQINLTWTASTDNVGVASYVVERCQGSGCTTFAQVGTPTAANFNDTTGLTAGTTYSYRVRAKDGAGNTGPYSSVANATTQSASTAPTTVTFTASTDHNTTLV